MAIKLKTVNWQFSLIYLDYIIFLKSQSEHVKYGHQVLRQIADPEDTLKVENYSHFSDGMEYLRPFIKPGKLKIAGTGMKRQETWKNQETWRNGTSIIPRPL